MLGARVEVCVSGVVRGVCVSKGECALSCGGERCVTEEEEMLFMLERCVLEERGCGRRNRCSTAV